MFTLSLLALSALPVLLVVAFVVRAIYLLYWHPLSTIPGPWYAAVSSLWITTHVLRLEQCKTIDALFQTYGPVVRIAPNKVAFCDLGASKSVYSRFDKSDYYKSLLTNDNDHAMTTLPHAQHSIRRKAYAPHYTPSNLAKLQPEIHETTSQMIDTLNRLPGNTALDTLSLFRNVALDIVCASSFGFRLGAVNKWTVETEDSLSVAVSDFPKRGILRSAVPKWAWNLVCKIPNKRLQLLCASDQIMAEFISARVQEVSAKLDAEPTIVAPTVTPFLFGFKTSSTPSSSRSASPCPSEDSSFVDADRSYLVSRLLSSKHLSEAGAVSEIMGHVVAGTDTTSISLSYFLWELTRRRDVLHKLRTEIDAAMPDASVVPDIKVLNKMEYLNAFIEEGLRIYGAAPSLLERVVPSQTSSNKKVQAVCADGLDLLGYLLPPGTIVGTQAWSMHRNPAVFPSPDTFLPERWIACDDSEEEADRLARMTNSMCPFGIGSRICGGKNLAQMILRILLVAILRNFEVDAAQGTDEKSMDMRGLFCTSPRFSENSH
ncbi:hypothetical protein MKEN_00889200 [Mycena kentingensis (nom. inval.)]|nr:hypothetical protein MKEN_00889200 [Mycena kentingensis (nom. inval.)]